MGIGGVWRGYEQRILGGLKDIPANHSSPPEREMSDGRSSLRNSNLVDMLSFQEEVPQKSGV